MANWQLGQFWRTGQVSQFGQCWPVGPTGHLGQFWRFALFWRFGLDALHAPYAETPNIARGLAICGGGGSCRRGPSPRPRVYGADAPPVRCSGAGVGSRAWKLRCGGSGWFWSVWAVWALGLPRAPRPMRRCRTFAGAARTAEVAEAADWSRARDRSLATQMPRHRAAAARASGIGRRDWKLRIGGGGQFGQFWLLGPIGQLGQLASLTPVLTSLPIGSWASFGQLAIWVSFADFGQLGQLAS